MRLTERASEFTDAPNFAHLSTLMPDGSPQVTPVWIDREGDTILINTAKDRVKYRNVLQDPRVGISILDRENSYERVVIFGRVEEITEKNADEHINRLSRKYLREGLQKASWTGASHLQDCGGEHRLTKSEIPSLRHVTRRKSYIGFSNPAQRAREHRRRDLCRRVGHMAVRIQELGLTKRTRSQRSGEDRR
jgi:PPOX class probable F420-dependent enzyme